MAFKDLYKNSPIELKQIIIDQWKAKQNPAFHPEGNTLKHIIVVTNRAFRDFPDNKNIQLAAYFHDLGKLATYDINPKTGQPTAYGHEEESVNLINKFNNFIKQQGANPEIVKYIVKNHMKIKPSTWDVIRPSKKDPILNDPNYQDLEKFSTIDKGGLLELQYLSQNKNQMKKIVNEQFVRIQKLAGIKLNEEEKIKANKSIYVLVGPPSVGKSTWIKQTFDKIQPFVINRDDIVEKVAGQYGWTYDDLFQTPIKDIDKEGDKHEKYGTVIKSPIGSRDPLSYDKVLEANKKVQDIFNQRVAQGKGKENIVVDMTNMSAGARKGALKAIEGNEDDYHKVAVVFNFKGAEDIIKKMAAKRSEEMKAQGKSKTIPPDAFDRMFSNFQQVSSDEGFDEVVNVDNIEKFKQSLAENKTNKMKKTLNEQLARMQKLAGITQDDKFKLTLTEALNEDENISQEIQTLIDKNDFLKGKVKSTPADIIEGNKFVLLFSEDAAKHITERHLDKNKPGSLFKSGINLRDIAKKLININPSEQTNGRVKWLGVKAGNVGEMGVAKTSSEEVAKMKDYTMPDGAKEQVKITSGKRKPTDEVSLITAELGVLGNGKKALSMITMFPGGMKVDGTEIPMDRGDFASKGLYFVVDPSSPLLKESVDIDSIVNEALKSYRKSLKNKIKETPDPQSGKSAPYGSGYAPFKKIKK
jgi:hypothetical protein